MTRIFVNVGAMDNARPGDLVGAITNEAHITSAQVGKIDIRENHSLVEIATDVADTVISKLTGSTIRGRRVVARIDQDRPARTGMNRGGRPADRGDRGPRREGPPRRDQGRDRGPADRGPIASDRPRGDEPRGGDRSAHPRTGGREDE
jgi:ATP-dependent RNA helicase DeaD